MVHHVGSFEAKTRLAELLRLAERGDEVVVLRRGQRVAVIMGASRYDQVTQSTDADWREAARRWISEGPTVSTADFRKIMADAKRGRP
jgi:prevent-host-death family protein